MVDTCQIEEQRVQPASPKPAPTLLARIVRASLQRELEMRRDRAPHAQLGVVVGADLPTIHRAFVRLRSHFDPRAYSAHGPEAVALAEEILALVEAAYCVLGRSSRDGSHGLEPLVPKSRLDETLRALETLRGSIARRKGEALRLAAQGHSAEARRMFEAVLRLDPHDEVSRAQLRRLRRAPGRGLRAFIAWLVSLFVHGVGRG